MPATRCRATILVMLLAIAPLAGGCVPSLGPFVVGEASGRVVDADTGEPIPGALVLEWRHGGGFGDGSRSVHHSRVVRSGPEGRFRFEREVGWSLRLWLLRSYGPRYDFYHPSYGLVRGPRGPEGPIVLRGSLRDSAQRLGDVTSFCRGGLPSRAARALAEHACPLGEDPGYWPTGVPRARGEHDARGRRHGLWIFMRENATPIALGRYRHGAPLGEWEFFPPRGRGSSGSSRPD